MGKITPPSVLTAEHNLANFDCGEDTLNHWLKKLAVKNQISGASKSFVCCHKTNVIGYYALASGSVERAQAPSAISRNMPANIPVIILARLAVDKQFQQQSLGSHLLKDALMRVLNVSINIGVKAVLVHALTDNVKAFYLQYDFKQVGINSYTLFLPVTHIKNYFL